MKKKMLLLLSALIVVPAWAEEAAVVAPKAAATPAAPAAAVVIDLKGQAKDVAALVADLEKEAAYKEAACAMGRKTGKAAKIKCAKADAGLLSFLGQYASAKVQWSISGATTVAVSTETATTTFAVRSTLACPTGCVTMACPPPSGPSACCHKVGGRYQPC